MILFVGKGGACFSSKLVCHFDAAKVLGINLLDRIRFDSVLILSVDNRCHKGARNEPVTPGYFYCSLLSAQSLPCDLLPMCSLILVDI